jgi:hypothetical protein
VQKLVHRFEAQGEAAFTPRSRRPQGNPRAVRVDVEDRIVLRAAWVRPGCGLADRLAQRSSISNSEPCGSSHGPSVNSMEQLTECRSECCKSSRPANRAVKPTGCRILMPRPRVIPAGQPDQSQPRRRNSNTGKTPTMSSEVPARRIRRRIVVTPPYPASRPRSFAHLTAATRHRGGGQWPWSGSRSSAGSSSDSGWCQGSELLAGSS